MYLLLKIKEKIDKLEQIHYSKFKLLLKENFQLKKNYRKLFDSTKKYSTKTIQERRVLNLILLDFNCF